MLTVDPSNEEEARLAEALGEPYYALSDHFTNIVAFTYPSMVCIVERGTRLEIHRDMHSAGLSEEMQEEAELMARDSQKAQWIARDHLDLKRG